MHLRKVFIKLVYIFFKNLHFERKLTKAGIFMGMVLSVMLNRKNVTIILNDRIVLLTIFRDYFIYLGMDGNIYFVLIIVCWMLVKIPVLTFYGC